MSICLIKIKNSAFNAGQPLEGVSPADARIPIGHGINGSGSFAARGELKNVGYRNPAAVIATTTGHQVAHENFLNGMPFDGFRAPLADLVNKGVVEVLVAGAAASIVDILAGTM